MNKTRLESYIKAHEELGYSCCYDDYTIKFTNKMNPGYLWYQISIRDLNYQIQQMKIFKDSRYVIWFEDPSCCRCWFGYFHSNSEKEIIRQLNFWREESGLKDKFVLIVYDMKTDTFTYELEAN